MVMVRNFDMKL